MKFTQQDIDTIEFMEWAYEKFRIILISLIIILILCWIF